MNKRLLTILYKVGVLTNFLDAVARVKGDNESDEGVDFSDYFDFSCEDHVEIDSEDRITFLGIYWYWVIKQSF